MISHRLEYLVHGTLTHGSFVYTRTTTRIFGIVVRVSEKPYLA